MPLLKSCCFHCLVCIVISAVQSISSFLFPGPHFNHPCDFIRVSLVDITVTNPSFLLLQNKIFLSVNLIILLQLKSPIEDSSRLLSEILHDWTTSISQPTPPLLLLILSFMNCMRSFHTLYLMLLCLCSCHSFSFKCFFFFLPVYQSCSPGSFP